MKHIQVAAVTVMLFAVESSVWAGQSSAARVADPQFSKGTWDVEVAGGYAWEFYPYDHQKFATGSIGVGYYPVDNFAISFQLPGYAVQQSGSNARMFGLNLSLRDHFFQWDRLSLFCDLIGGVAQASGEVPPGGTYFNFTAQGGLGATYRLKPNVHLIGGVHVFHLSNAAIEGIQRNPDLNSVVGYAGILFTF